MGMAERGLGKFRGAYLATRILYILVKGADMLEMGMESAEENTTSVGGVERVFVVNLSQWSLQGLNLHKQQCLKITQP